MADKVHYEYEDETKLSLGATTTQYTAFTVVPQTWLTATTPKTMHESKQCTFVVTVVVLV